jgi:hypothetical protein
MDGLLETSTAVTMATRKVSGKAAETESKTAGCLEHHWVSRKVEGLVDEKAA